MGFEPWASFAAFFSSIGSLIGYLFAVLLESYVDNLSCDESSPPENSDLALDCQSISLDPLYLMFWRALSKEMNPAENIQSLSSRQ